MEENKENSQRHAEAIDADTVSLNLPMKQEVAERTALFIGDGKAASRYLDAIQEFRRMIPRATKPGDWVSFGDPNDPAKASVHLQEFAASQVSRLLQTKFGYTIKINMPARLTYPGSPIPFGVEKMVDGVAHIEIIVEGSVEVTDNATGQTEVIGPIYGASATSDGFFGKRHGEVIDPRSIPLGNLLKKAVANYKGNCYREIWGLKGFTLKDLEDCGLDIKLVIDSQRRGAGSGSTPEEKDAKQQLWDRIVRVQDGKADLARTFLKNMTSYPAGKRADGTAYQANEGYTDINRIYLTDKNGAENKTYRKILNALDKLEKEKGIAAEETQGAAESAPTQGAGGHGKKKLDYIAQLGECKTEDQVLKLEQKIAKDTTLAKSDIDDLQGRVSRKFDQLTVDKDQTGGKR